MQTQGLNDNSARWVKIINADPSGDDIPAFGVVELAADQDEDGFFPVRKPTSDGSMMVLIAAGANIPSGQKGQASWASPIPCRYDPLDGRPEVGDIWGPASGSWLLSKNKTGFRIFGSYGSNIVNVVRDPTAVSNDYYGYFGAVPMSGTVVVPIIDVNCNGGTLNKTTYTLTLTGPGLVGIIE